MSRARRPASARADSGGRATTPHSSPSIMPFITIPRKPRVENATKRRSFRSPQIPTAWSRFASCQTATIAGSWKTAGPLTRAVAATSRTYRLRSHPTNLASGRSRRCCSWVDAGGGAIDSGARRGFTGPLQVLLAGLGGDLVEDRLDLLGALPGPDQEGGGGGGRSGEGR